jgi:uncharacterized protein (DUF362 family)
MLFGEPDIVTISGDDPMTNLVKLIQPLGGIERFVPKGSTVGFLANSPWKNPGSFTHPDIVLGMMKLCLDAGAGKLVCLHPAHNDYWGKSRYSDSLQDLINSLAFGSERTDVEIPKAVSLKKASVYKEFLSVDVFINIPVAKHHAGVNYSGTLKGLMGVTSSDTNRFMHSPDGQYTYDKHEYLAQCIADLNLVRRPDLCIVDATECLLSNGPAGPGDTVKPNKLLAATDPVAVDVYAADLIGFDVSTILTFDKAARHGLGKTDLAAFAVTSL